MQAYSRNLKIMRFDSLKKSLAILPVKSAIIDGEIVCLDGKGVSQFNQLLNKKAEPVFYAFEFWRDSQDLRRLPLLERKMRIDKRWLTQRIPAVRPGVSLITIPRIWLPVWGIGEGKSALLTRRSTILVQSRELCSRVRNVLDYRFPHQSGFAHVSCEPRETTSHECCSERPRR